MPLLKPEFYRRPTPEVARALLGMRLVGTVEGKKVSGMIVETEAYLATGDDACHGCRGKAKSNGSMFGTAGLAYVYPIHARHCFNVVTGEPGEPTAVLIRAVQPLDGIATMEERRDTARVFDLTRGPGRLCEAFGFNRDIDGLMVTTKRTVWIDDEYPVGVDVTQIDDSQIKATKRIGVTSAHDLLLRYVVVGNSFVSGTRERW